ncbi:MAG: AAA family ATPase [Fibrobacter sp.]|nr:AAA family ATPase [Fibrobacter sp.]
MQQIFFGAPGTGKSHKVNELVGEPKSFLVANDREARFGQFSQCGCAKANHYADVLSKQETFNQDVFAINNLEELKCLLESCDGDDKVKNPRHSALRAYIDFVSQPTVFRTTFHPDYDYAQFVGSYKPKKNGAVITYDFVPQVFAKAYKRAKETSEPVYLVIEEINRGNCAQIFGDIFQLLDRNESGESQYEIDVDSDFAEWLGESKIKLPPNFNILATMNTSDQSLFPMDSAFKRRFDWEYVPIKYAKANEGDEKNPWEFEVVLKGEKEQLKFNWIDFLKKVNADIYKVTESEDKQMGEFFVKPKDGVIGLDMFRSKILFYLWDSVYKDEPDKKNVFHFDNPDKSGSKVTFQSLFSDDAKAIEIINQMMKNLDEAYESKDDSEFKDFKILK